ncbi:hypothetical protein [Methylobacterium sp. J-067]|uniref:hypothetical protein n=1 Tax=Methylobacterium sp. J-067 TaxID=2836648 RepID=UPI001FBA2FCE|nr:hypothetical protein [Methylobacterium sp. J-067]MCJ2024709.1 hypothetical protein [Methylobacterium sp. J-067]
MTERKPKAEAPMPSLKRDPTPHEAAAMAKAAAYCRSRTEPPAYQVKRVEGHSVTVDAPHNELAGFVALQSATFGTASSDFASRTAAEVMDIVRSRGESMPTEDQINAGVAAVAGIEPQNEAEAMLAAQMVGTHSVAMDMLSRAKQATSTGHLERYGTLATKLLRTYTAQLEALAKVRRGGAQKVVVEHVHVHAGGQAIVGHVTGAQGGARGGQIENGQQPYARALTGPAAVAFQADPSMLREDAGRDALPIASGEGEGPMPDARRGQRKRRTKG